MNKENQYCWIKAGEEWVGIHKVEFLDIEENMHGEDVMTFEYEGVEYQSVVIRGSKPEANS